MKIRLLIILFVLVLIPVQLIYAPPSPNEWPDAPYCPRGCTLDYLKEKWALYYDYKGAEWMNQKKIELLDAIKTDTLTEWMKLTPNGANSNVHDYYFYMGEIPNHNDIYVKQYFEGYIPPLKQFRSGITADQIQCNVGLVLIQKVDYSPACVKSESLEKLRERGWAKLLFEVQIQSDQTNSHFNSQKIQNKFPNVAQRQVVMQLHDQKSQDGALGITILDKITREKPSDDVVYIEIIKQWENFKIPESMFFNITLEGDDTPASKPFLIQQSLMESHAGSLKDQFYFSLPVNVPLLAKAEQGVILFNYTMPDVLPKDDKYHLKFASFSDVEVELPKNAIIIENNTREYSEFWSYDENYALTHKADHLTIDYPSSIDVNSVIIYDITFEIRK